MSSPHRFVRPEDYLYPGTDVLRNRLGLTGAPELARAERASTIFGGLATEDLLMGLTATEFADGAAALLADLNALHPFREGNGRAQRAFLELLSDHAGHPIVWPLIGPDRMFQASIDAMRGDNIGLRSILWESLPAPRD